MQAIEIAAIVAGYALALLRLLNAARPLWAWAPTWVQVFLPALVTTLPALAEQLGMAKTGLDLTETVFVFIATLSTAARGRPDVLTRGSGRRGGPPAVGAGILVFMLSGCASLKPTIQTVNDLAIEACTIFYADRDSILFEDARRICHDLDVLQPFIEEITKAQKAAGARAQATGKAPAPREAPDGG